MGEGATLSLMDLSDFTCSVCDEPSYGVGSLEFEHCRMHRESLCGRCYKWAVGILFAGTVRELIRSSKRTSE